MSSFTILAILVAAGVIAYFVGRFRSIQSCGGKQRELHSRPTYHGHYLAIIAALPLVALLIFFQRQMVRGLTAGAVKG